MSATTKDSRLALVTAVSISLAMCFPGIAAAFPGAPPGTPLRNRDLKSLSGARTPWLAEGRVNVFIFFRPGHAPSLETLTGLAQLEEEFRDKPVRFTALVSDSFRREEVEADARLAGIRMPLLVDAGDEVYGELGVTLYPAVGITDAGQRLSGYQHWLSVHMRDSLRARIRHALGEIDAVQLTAELDPDPSGGAGPRAEARARREFARMLRASGRCELARREMEVAAQLTPDDPPEEGDHPLACAAH
jgi:thiol-disulfide isomerase/thioredoxin